MKLKSRRFGSRAKDRCHPHYHYNPEDFSTMGGQFGVRRPVRYLAYKLDLDESQVKELARIIDELKTERAQAAVDERRTQSVYADAFGSDQFDLDSVTGASNSRADSQRKIGEAVTKALQAIHALLDEEQRQKMAYLIRTGTLNF